VEVWGREKRKKEVEGKKKKGKKGGGERGGGGGGGGGGGHDKNKGLFMKFFQNYKVFIWVQLPI